MKKSQTLKNMSKNKRKFRKNKRNQINQKRLSPSVKTNKTRRHLKISYKRSSSNRPSLSLSREAQVTPKTFPRIVERRNHSSVELVQRYVFMNLTFLFIFQDVSQNIISITNFSLNNLLIFLFYQFLGKIIVGCLLHPI